MTIPTGYRLATADDLREGAEVLIPATIDEEGDARGRVGGYSAYVLSYMLPGLALVRDAATEPTLGEHEASAIRLRASIADLTAECDRWRLRAEKAEADLRDLRAAVNARDLMTATSDRLRRDLANATDAALRSALTTGSLSEAIRVAGVLCGIDAADQIATLSALVECARGGR